MIKEIFEKDIRKRVKIRKKETFELVRQYIINNFGATTSINNICDELKKGGNSISKATVSRYIKALVDEKILYECDRFDMKSKKMLSGSLFQRRSGIAHVNLMNFIKEGREF